MRFLVLILAFLIYNFSYSQAGNRNLFLRATPTTPPPSGGNVPFSFTEIPYSDPDIINPGRGAEQWHNGSEAINNPTSGSLTQSWDLYYRFEWARLEGATQGSYVFGTYTINGSGDTVWNYFDKLLQEAASKGQQFSFGIMPFYSDGGVVNYDGADASYPRYLHNAMQALPLNQRDTVAPSGNWMPNWNSSIYLSRLRALHVALNNYLLTAKIYPTTGPHAGEEVNVRDIIYCIDIRGFGDYGEWHSGGMWNFGQFPTGRQPTANTLIEIIDAHTEVFEDWPLVMMVAGYNGSNGASYIPIFHPYNEVGYYALKATNAWGKVGNRRDQFGATDGYLDALLQNNNTVVDGERFGTLYVNLFKTAPGTGEPLPGAAPINGMVELEQQVIEYGETSFGNGNWGGFPNSSVQNIIRSAFKRCGYRLKITTGEAPTIITRSSAFTIKTNWVNVGVTPAYNNWTVQFELQTGGGTVVWTGTSSKVLKLFRPDQGTVETTDVLTVPNSVSAGTYKLVVRVKDPVNYRPNMRLAIQGRNSDGTYTIFNSVTVN